MEFVHSGTGLLIRVLTKTILLYLFSPWPGSPFSLLSFIYLLHHHKAQRCTLSHCPPPPSPVFPSLVKLVALMQPYIAWAIWWGSKLLFLLLFLFLHSVCLLWTCLPTGSWADRGVFGNTFRRRRLPVGRSHWVTSACSYSDIVAASSWPIDTQNRKMPASRLPHTPAAQSIVKKKVV